VQAEGAARLALEIPLRRDTRIAQWCSSSPTCPCSSALPTRAIHALWWFPQGNDIAHSLREALTRHFDLRPGSGEDRRFVADRLRWLKPKQQLGAALGTRILRQQQNARLCSLGSKAITMPGCQRHTRDELRGKAAHVQHDGTETSA